MRRIDRASAERGQSRAHRLRTPALTGLGGELGERASRSALGD